MLKVLMVPHLKHFRTEESGIKRVCEAYHHYLPRFDIELVEPDAASYDIKAAHAGTAGGDCDVSMVHGLYWTSDYPAQAWEWKANASVIASIRSAKLVTVPSEWVAESLRRDMHLDPAIVPHGIDWRLWNAGAENQGYVLWNKNRSGVDVCSPEPVGVLARKFPNTRFLTTFAPDNPTPNIKATGVVKHSAMKSMVEHAAVYLASVKETFGIGILESLAAGVPVLGFRHGGVCDIVRHGVDGYLAEPGNYDDLAEGLNYCLAHRAILGANATQRARAFSWEAVAERVAGIYRQAAQPEEPTISVVIPCYNKADTVGRAIDSVKAQTITNLECIIVDDGSTDNSKDIILDAIKGDRRFRYVRQANQHVAAARNNGIRQSRGLFICCLDADDWVDPRFLEACIAPLEADRSLGVAYTRLMTHFPDGRSMVSQWPGEFDYDKQIKRHNQIPTCAVFRRQCWECTGGYRSRYCVTGAGSEDADFWTRLGALGYGATLATDEALFHYSAGTGHTSQEGYSEVDWLGDKPWVHDGLHPFASVATPRKMSHAVRQYDQPTVSVIIPVGPGHEEYLVDALDSVENQSHRQWEAIVVWDAGAVGIERMKEHMAAYPFAKFLVTSIEGSSGAGVARNLGARAARAPFLVFLDADDILHMRALESMLDAWSVDEAIVYTDYLGKAHVEDVSKLSDKLQRRIVSRNEKTHETTIRHEAFDYDWRRAQRQPEGAQPYIWCNVTCLIPAAWHNAIGGFDESMHSWEDVDYHYRLARQGKAYVRIPEPLMTYRFYSGARRENGRQDHKNLIEYLQDKYEGVPTMACSSCGRNRHSAPQPKILMNISQAAPEMSDENFVMVRLVDGKRGNHAIIGDRTKNKYGHRAHGDAFLMHRDDIAARPGAFEIVKPAHPAAPSQKAQPTPPPALQDGAKVPTAQKIAEPVVIEKQATAGSPTADLSAVIVAPERPFDLQTVPGVTAAIARQLSANGVDSLEALASLRIDDLQAVKGVGEARAEQIHAWAQEQLK